MIDADRLPSIAAERVVLRWLTDSDVDALFGIYSNAEVTRYWSTPVFERREQAQQLLHEIHRLFERRELFEWGVALAGEDRVIGTVTLSHLDAANRRAEIGFALGREFWGHGYMAEALRALLDFAFDRLDLHRLEADVDPDNHASIRALDRLGFQREGFLRERWIVGGEFFDTAFFGLLAREWRARRSESAGGETGVPKAPED